MGHVYAKVVIRGTKGEEILQDVLVDTGATFTTMPSKIAAKVGAIGSPWKVSLIMGDKRKLKASVYLAEVELNGRRGPARLAVAKEVIPTIGVDTLETLGLMVNPMTGRLEPRRGDYLLFV